MRFNIFLSLLVLILLFPFYLSAQSVYPKFDKDSYIEIVKIKGQKPTIIDFVNHYLHEPEDELTGSLNDMWQSYLAQKPQKEACKILVDVKNGYVKFESVADPADKYLSVTEMCYWNCADGKHRLIAFSNNLYIDDKPIEGQYTGISFALYENSTRRLQYIPAASVGAAVTTAYDGVTHGFDGDNWFVENNGVRKTMSQQEYEEYLENRPVLLYKLPQKGKNIIVEIWSPKEVIKKELTWNGLRFKESADMPK